MESHGGSLYFFVSQLGRAVGGASVAGKLGVRSRVGESASGKSPYLWAGFLAESAATPCELHVAHATQPTIINIYAERRWSWGKEGYTNAIARDTPALPLPS